jgi:hypothetical protein
MAAQKKQVTITIVYSSPTGRLACTKGSRQPGARIVAAAAHEPIASIGHALAA